MKTVEEQLEFINRTCNTDYKSMEDVDWDYISKYQILSKDFMDEFNININQPKKIIWTEPSPYDKAIILTEPTGPLEEDPLQLKTRNIKLYENELLEVLKNPQLPTLITNIQDLELLLHKIDKQINENNFYHIEVKWTGDGITDGESNDDIFDLETGIFTEEELKEYMQYLHSFYEKKLNKLKYQYLNIFNGVKYRLNEI